MDFALTEEQKMLKKSARDFLDANYPASLARHMAGSGQSYSAEIWRKIAQLGWLGLVVPTKYGGEGYSYLDLVVLLEETGRSCLFSAFSSTVVLGILPLLEAASEPQKQELFPKISCGDLRLTTCLGAGSHYPMKIKLEARARGGDFLLSGFGLFVPDAELADYLVCVAELPGETGPSLFIVDARSQGITVSPLSLASREEQSEVRFEDVVVPLSGLMQPSNGGQECVSAILRKAAVSRCAEMVGAAERILEMAVDYAKQRVQFERPIGSFQAIQHHCADMLVDVDSSRLMTYRAAWQLSQEIPHPDAEKKTSMAKAWVSQAYGRVIALAHQVHGGVSFMEDHDLPLFTKRSITCQFVYGDADFHRDIVATQLHL